MEDQKAQKEDWFLRGRQIAYMIYEYFRVTGTHESIFDFSDLMGVTVRGMMSNVLIRDGMKFSYRSKMCQRITCTR